jgi:[acyl-carrier-protein] S-malonyltransferase
MKQAAIFPGQGAQFPGMGRDLAAAFPEAAERFAEADRILGFPLSSTCFSGPAEIVNRTDICQPGIFLVSAVTMEVLSRRLSIERSRFGAAAGLSLGEYTALWFAGAISFSDGLRLTRLRGELMQKASEARASGMTSVLGLDLPKIEEVCAGVRAEGGIVCVANLNSPGQVVISGAAEDLAKAAERLKAAGARRLLPLQVAGAFHSPLMAPAAEALRAKLDSTDVRRAEIPVVANVTAGSVTEPSSIRELLTRQLTSPVLFERSVRHMAAEGFSEFVEPGPGRVLAGLLKKIVPEAVVHGYPDAATIQGGAS